MVDPTYHGPFSKTCVEDQPEINEINEFHVMFVYGCNYSIPIGDEEYIYCVSWINLTNDLQKLVQFTHKYTCKIQETYNQNGLIHLCKLNTKSLRKMLLDLVNT
ncbi:hypothetical protein Hanom_Chr04g00336901 [Helianthus anomalus]